MANHAISTPVPTVRPGYRLVAALIGTRKSSHVAWIQCPTFCAENHMADPTMFEDITHTSRSEEVGISSFLKRDGSLLMYAMLQTDPEATDPRLRQAHIGIEHEGVPDYHTPDMAEKFADDLITFAVQVRHLAREARLHNQTAGDSDPGMVQALRLVREGGVV